MASIVPSECLRAQLDAAVQGVGEEQDPIESIGRLGARLILQQALEEELTDFLGRARYERTGEPTVHRNGYEPTTVKTTAGALELERPRLRDASALGFASQLVGKGVARTHAARGARDRLLPARAVGARRRGRARGGLRRAARVEVDGGAHLSGHARALPRLVRPPARGARRRLLLPRRALPQAAAQRRARRGRAGLLGRDARGPQGAARAGARQPRELRQLARLRP